MINPDMQEYIRIVRSLDVPAFREHYRMNGIPVPQQETTAIAIMHSIRILDSGLFPDPDVQISEAWYRDPSHRGWLVGLSHSAFGDPRPEVESVRAWLRAQGIDGPIDEPEIEAR